jgi:hypothetical protein
LGHFFCSTAPQAFFRPDRNSQHRRAQGLSRLAVAPSARRTPTLPGHTFTAPSTAADWCDRGRRKASLASRRSDSDLHTYSVWGAGRG